MIERCPAFPRTGKGGAFLFVRTDVLRSFLTKKCSEGLLCLSGAVAAGRFRFGTEVGSVGPACPLVWG